MPKSEFLAPRPPWDGEPTLSPGERGWVVSILTANEAPEPQVRTVPLAWIRKEPRVAPCMIPINPSRVAVFLDLILSRAELSPIRVWLDGATYWLSDGLHRLTAAEKAGETKILCDVRPGGFCDAEWDSFGSISGELAQLSLGGIEGVLSRVLRCAGRSVTGEKVASHLGVASCFIRYWRTRRLARGTVARDQRCPDETIRKAIEHIGGSLASRMAVPTLARAIAISAPQLSRRFRRAGQPSPKILIDELRMERARDLLRTSDFSVKEISVSVGYGRPDQFSAAFARMYGQPPGTFRRFLNKAAISSTESAG